MTYNLLIGQRLYSSWSLRGWLPFAVHDIPVTVHDTLLYGDAFYDDVAKFGGNRTVPTVKTPEGGIWADSLSICWGLADAFPDRGLLPTDPIARAQAQSLIAEMHSGFTALRGDCPMNLATGWLGFVPSEAVKTDLSRIDAVWSSALDASNGPFLFGEYGLVDAFFAPVAIRIAGYDLPVSETAKTYVTAQLYHPAMQQWRKDGLMLDTELSQYDMALERCPFPMP
ncbi:glutathione S-transferase [Octadecabacter sp. CECT 8868]|uniref:glutathione S-transferase n=1 Tax=Octadecabacter algicola TaxID=2909342 RepID=UPI001F3C8E41|nr:glutathione S-transferase [Octadecabacter algicola]MCF2906553.1 glutathione S-transferase [Octadecabacter algicola]